MDDAIVQRMKQALTAPTEETPQPQATPQPADQPTAPDLIPEQTAMDATGLKAGDLGNAVLGAGRDAVQGAWDTANDLGPSISQWADRNGLNVTGMRPIQDGEKIAELPEVPRADESTGTGAAVNMSRDVGKFILGFLGAGSALKSVGMAEGLGRTLLAGGIGDFLVTGAHDQRLVDFFDQFPSLQNPVLDALHSAGTEEGDLWKRKLVAAGEGVMVGGALEGLVRTVGWLRKVVAAQRSGDPKEVQAALHEAEPELQKAYQETTKEVPEGSPSSRSLAPDEEIKPPANDNVEVRTDGDTFEHPVNGKQDLPLSDAAKAELKGSMADGVPFEKLSPETQAEVKGWLSKNPDLIPEAPPPKYEPAFKLDDAQRADFEKALETSLTVPYATLRAENPGAALEDTLGSYFNYRKMTGPDEVKLSLSSLADSMAPAINKTGGGSVQTFARVSEMADWLGTKPDVLMGSLQQIAGHADKMPALVVAGKTWMQSLTNDILKVAQKVRSGIATDAEKEYMHQMTDVLGDLVGNVKNVQRAAARTTSAGRISTGVIGAEDAELLKKQVGDKTFDFVSNLLGLTDGTPRGLISLLEPTWGEKAMGILHEFWMNSVLSKVATQVVNITGNARNTFLYPAFRMAGGALTGDSKSLQTGLAQYAALRTSIFDSFEMAGRAFKANAPILNPVSQQLEGRQGFIRAGTFGVQDDSIFGTGINWLGNTIGMPSRFLTSGDEFFGQLNYRASVQARAHVEGVQQGLKGPELDAYVNDALTSAFNPKNGSGYSADGVALNKPALRDSEVSKFTQSLALDKRWLGAKTSLGEIVQKAASDIPAVRHLALPFVKVPVNIFREMVAESPLAPIRAQFWHDMSVGGEARADAVGRLALGSMFSVGGAMLAAEGYITGGGPSDPQRNKEWRAAGNVPYAVRIPGAGEDGRDLFVPYQRFDPVAGQLGIIADFAYISAHVDERTQNNLAVTIALSLANNLNNKGYLQSLSDLLGVLKSSRDVDGPRKVQQWLNSRAASYVPGIVTSFKTDDTLHEVRGVLDAVQNRIPGLASGLPPMRDNFGEPLLPPIGWPWREVNPFSLAQGKFGPGRSEMNHWSEGPTATRYTMPSPTIGGAIDLRDYKNPATGQNAYDRWMELLTTPMFNGRTAEQDIDRLVQSDGYKDAKKNGVEDPIYRQHPAAEMIRADLARHYEVAKEKMLSEPGFADLHGALAQFAAKQRVVPYGGGPQMPTNPTLQDLLHKK